MNALRPTVSAAMSLYRALAIAAAAVAGLAALGILLLSGPLADGLPAAEMPSVLVVLSLLILGAAGIVAVTVIRMHAGHKRALRRARESAARFHRQRSLLFAMMSHEIRTPVNGVIGLANLLLESRLDPEQRRQVRTVANSGRAVLGIVNDILDFSRIESGYLRLQKAEFSVADLIGQVADLLAPMAAERGLDLYPIVPRTCAGPVEGDAGRVRQVLVNLAANAVKYTERGAVAVAVDRVADDPDCLRFTVEDTGTGLPPEVMSNLFAEFAQGGEARNARIDSTGLGLAVSRRLVDAMGGRIGVDSQAGQGTRFWFELPLPAASSKAPPGDDPAERLLVAGAPGPSRAFLVRQLAAWGYRVDTADAPNAVLCHLDQAAAQNSPYRFVLIDRLGEDDEGIALAHHIAGVSDTTPIVAVARWDAVARVSSGGDPVTILRRPVDHDALAEVLRGVHDHRRSAPLALTKPLRVLVAEDNPVSREVTIGRLRRGGHQVEAVTTGRAAVDAVRKMPFDLVLMDVRMPEMDGLEATLAIRALGPAGAAVPIVALTAEAGTEERERCLAAGANDCLPKLLDQTTLEAVLARWCGAGGVAEEPLFERSVVDELVQTLGPAEYAALADLFFQDAGRMIDRLLAEAAPAAAIPQMLHSLKGAARNLGLVAAAEHLEAVRRRPDGEDPAKSLNRLRLALERQRVEVLRRCSEGVLEKSSLSMKKGIAGIG